MKRGLYIAAVFIVIILSSSLVSAGWLSDFFKKLFGIEAEPGICIDSDSINYNVQETVNFNGINYTDKCIKTWFNWYNLLEYYCLDGKLLSKKYKCEECSDGACVSNESGGDYSDESGGDYKADIGDGSEGDYSDEGGGDYKADNLSFFPVVFVPGGGVPPLTLKLYFIPQLKKLYPFPDYETLDFTSDEEIAERCSINHIEKVAGAVQEVLNRTGASKVNVVGHSKGGQDLMTYIRFGCGWKYVNNFVTLAGVNRWENHLNGGYYCSDVICNEVNCGVNITDYKQLEIQDNTPGNVLYTEIIGVNDSAVPKNATFLKGGHNFLINREGRMLPAGYRDELRSDSLRGIYIDPVIRSYELFSSSDNTIQSTENTINRLLAVYCRIKPSECTNPVTGEVLDVQFDFDKDHVGIILSPEVVNWTAQAFINGGLNDDSPTLQGYSPINVLTGQPC